MISVTSRAHPHPSIHLLYTRIVGNLMQSTPLSTQKIEDVLDDMKKKHVTFKDILSYILDDRSSRCSSYRRWMFDDLESILTRIYRYKKGRNTLRAWSLSSTCKIVDREMHKVEQVFAMNAREITPEFVKAWSLASFQRAIKEKTPTLCKVPLTGVQTARMRNEGKVDPMVVRLFPRLAATSLANVVQVILAVVSQMDYHRSHYAMQFQALLGLFWWSSGAPCQSIHILQRCGLSISYDPINQILSELSAVSRRDPAHCPIPPTSPPTIISASPYHRFTSNVRMPRRSPVWYGGRPLQVEQCRPGPCEARELLECDREGRDLHFSDNDQPSLSPSTSSSNLTYSTC